jgi:hypothetical protein
MLISNNKKRSNSIGQIYKTSNYQSNTYSKTGYDRLINYA